MSEDAASLDLGQGYPQLDDAKRSFFEILLVVQQTLWLCDQQLELKLEQVDD
jgi:hypothetical protein